MFYIYNSNKTFVYFFIFDSSYNTRLKFRTAQFFILNVSYIAFALKLFNEIINDKISMNYLNNN